MLCSECNKNPAILFYKKIEDGKESLEGYCYDCAKKKGINPTEVLSQQNNFLSHDKLNINDMSKQFESIFKDLAENINLEDLENIEGAITFDNIDGKTDDDGESSKISGAAIPLGSIFNMFQNNNNNEEETEPSTGRKKVKVEKRPKQNKKKKFLDTFGTNLTTKAKNNQLDMVIGREKEIQRIVQILNRRSKNNP